MIFRASLIFKFVPQLNNELWLIKDPLRLGHGHWSFCIVDIGQESQDHKMPPLHHQYLVVFLNFATHLAFASFWENAAQGTGWGARILPSL